MQKLAEICVRRPVFATVIILALVVFGAFSYMKLGVDRFPNIEFPFVTVTTILPGAAPEEVETEVTDKIEEAVNTISGIEELYSFSSENISVLQISFDLAKDGDVAAQEVRDKVSAILGDLPTDAESPIVLKLDPGAIPVITIAVSGPGGQRDVSEYADKTLRRRLETVSGVGQVLVIGARPRQINVIVDNAKLAAQGLTAAHVVAALQSQNIQIPGGKVEQGLRDLTLRTYGRVATVEEFGAIPVATRNGTPIRVRDVARVDDSMSEVESAATVGGKSAVVLMVRKQSGTNAIEIADLIKERVEELRPQLPAGYKLDITRDQSTFVIAAVDAVKEHLILGSIFAALIVWLFLSSPRFWHVLLMVGGTMTLYFFIWGLEDLHRTLPKLGFSLSILLLGLLLVAAFQAIRGWRKRHAVAGSDAEESSPLVKRLAIAVVVLAFLVPTIAPVPGEMALDLLNVAGLAIGIAMFWFFSKTSRPTLIAAVAIPASLISTFAAMAYMGFTLNIITLLALTLAVGIVIDDAVVVLENIFRHMEEKGLSPMRAAVEGTKEVGLAVMATSMSLIVVFLPVAFMGGIVGRFMYSFGVTMAFAIAVSLLVSFTLTPMMASRYLRREDLHHENTRETGLYAKIEGAYMVMLDWSMAHRWVIIALMFVVFASMLIPKIGLFAIVDKTFLPFDDEGQFMITMRAPEGSSIATTQKISESIATRVRAMPDVATTVITIGDDPQQTLNLASIYVKLKGFGDRDQDQYEVMDQIRREILPQYQRLNLRTQVAPVNEFGGGADAEVMFWIGGPDLAQLDKYSRELTAVIKDPKLGTTDVDTNFVIGKPELGVRIDRDKSTDLGVRVQDLAATLNVLVGGQQATSYYEGGEEYEVHVRADEESRNNVSAISQIEVPSDRGQNVRLNDLVTLQEGTGPSIINRLNRRRMVMVLANMQPGYSSQAVMDLLSAKAAEMKMPASFSYGFTGRAREQQKAGINFMLAFVLSIIFMYLILAAQFESWVHPITILLSLPMTVPFALLSLVLLNQSVNIFSALGIVVLFGIVKKNSILQVDHTNQLRERGLPRAEAIREANRDRFRPILMTTLAFVAGMVPLVASGGVGAATNRAIGATIIGGQTLVLLLTLLATPVLYSLFDDVQEWFRRRRPVQEEEAGSLEEVPAV
ncbi:MAG TPA: efflux RND transporter permease subunit [Thermoanaerobaculia bacterium]|jgi:multidrug efflux pump subunit AcrB|nr:efflux RND transporter permease subunit [Thermoanaerobaculia bacterium]